jgi:uncharacterized protein YndB with AHSA1/START domain
MKKLVFAVAVACLALVAIAATPAILGADGGAQSAGKVPSVPVKTDAETPTFELWFIKSTRGACCLVRSTTRTAEELGIPHVGADFAVGPHLIATLVEAWLAGPSPKEAALGFSGDFAGADSRLLGVSIENGIVTLDLSSEFRGNSGFVGLPALFALGSVVNTVTQFPEIEGVLFKLEGRPLPVPAGSDHSLRPVLHGCDLPEADELLDRPVTREDYENAVNGGPDVVKSITPTDGTFREYLITAEFDAPKHLVYKAWTTPELVERWWWASCGKVTTAEIDLRVGGTWRYMMVTSGGDEVVAHGTYREIVPNERIVATAIYDVHELEPGDPRHAQTLNTLTFTEVDGRTTLTILVQAQSKKFDVVFGMDGMEELEPVANSLR